VKFVASFCAVNFFPKGNCRARKRQEALYNLLVVMRRQPKFS
jgi:hypothetical protein